MFFRKKDDGTGGMCAVSVPLSRSVYQNMNQRDGLEKGVEACTLVKYTMACDPAKPLLTLHNPRLSFARSIQATQCHFPQRTLFPTL